MFSLQFFSLDSGEETVDSFDLPKGTKTFCLKEPGSVFKTTMSYFNIMHNAWVHSSEAFCKFALTVHPVVLTGTIYGVHLSGERHCTVRVKCQGQEHNSVTTPGLEPQTLNSETGALTISPNATHKKLNTHLLNTFNVKNKQLQLYMSPHCAPVTNLVFSGITHIMEYWNVFFFFNRSLQSDASLMPSVWARSFQIQYVSSTFTVFKYVIRCEW